MSFGELTFAKMIVEKKNANTKKAIYQKPTKSQKSLADRFGPLPPDDIAFIKALDKQFTTFGSNVKIKVVKENTTSNKYFKRTINGDLGYILF